jgi:hypothetical protein
MKILKSKKGQIPIPIQIALVLLVLFVMFMMYKNLTLTPP